MGEKEGLRRSSNHNNMTPASLKSGGMEGRRRNDQMGGGGGESVRDLAIKEVKSRGWNGLTQEFPGLEREDKKEKGTGRVEWGGRSPLS